MSESMLPLFVGKRKAEEDVAVVKMPRPENGEEAFREEGHPVYKIGYDKSITVRTSGKKEPTLVVIIGEWKRLPNGKDYERTEKGISLTMSQFNRLAGLLMSGTGDRPVGDDSVSTMHNLGMGVFFSWSKYNRMNLAQIRHYKKNMNGDQVPTKKGIAFGQRCYDTLKELLLKMTVHKEAGKLATETAGQGPEFKPLKEYIRMKLVDIVIKQRELQCEFCNATDKEASETDVHTCKLCKEAITDTERIMSEGLVKTGKLVEAFLLANNQVSAAQVLGLDVDNFLVANRNGLRGSDPI